MEHGIKAYAAQGASLGGSINAPNAKASAVDVVNQRLMSAHDQITEAITRVNLIANKMTGAVPPTEKAGAPVAIPSCSIDYLNEIERRLNELSNAIARLD